MDALRRLLRIICARTTGESKGLHGHCPAEVFEKSFYTVPGFLKPTVSFFDSEPRWPADGGRLH